MKILFTLCAFSFLGLSCTSPDSENKTSLTQKDSETVSGKDAIQSQPVNENAGKNISSENIQKAFVSKTDSSIWLTSDMKHDYRIFGYEKPDTLSNKMILLSIFTYDVEGNPHKCPLGAYYQSSDMGNTQLKFVSLDNSFVKANVINADTVTATIFIDKKWIEFDE